MLKLNMLLAGAALSTATLCAWATPPNVRSSDVRTNVDIEDLPADALRKRLRSHERELEDLQSSLGIMKSTLAEIESLEVSASSADEDPDTIERMSTVAGLGRAARIDMSEAIANIDLQSLKSQEAKSLYIAIRQVDIPKECTTKPARPESPAEDSISGRGTASASDEEIRACAAAFSQRVKEIRANTSEKILVVKNRITADIKAIEMKIFSLESAIEELESAVAAGDKLTTTIVRWTIPTVGLLLIAIFLGPKLYSDSIQAEIFSNKLNLELITVYILVSTILILGLANRIDNEVLGTLLGGISGYVLGRTLPKNHRDNPPANPAPAKKKHDEERDDGRNEEKAEEKHEEQEKMDK